jgi:glycerol-3-phosphate acyltransferase PlsY
MVYGILAIAVAYLIGSFPTAYLVTRFCTGKDIRKLGSGNVGAHNVYEHVGMTAAVVTGLVDIAKGFAAVSLALLMFGAPLLWVLASGLAVVVGHIWPVFLKFKGGNGIATTIGILSFLMTRELLIAIAVALLIVAITRNPILSINISLLITIPVASSIIRAIQGDQWIPHFAFSLVLIAILVMNFLPTMKTAMANAGSRGNMTAELMRIEKDKPAKKKKKR